MSPNTSPIPLTSISTWAWLTFTWMHNYSQAGG